MRQCILVSWCLWLPLVILTTSGLYIPSMGDYSVIKRRYTVLEPRKEYSGVSRRPWLRRRYGSFSKVMTRHALKFSQEKEFVEHMFDIFDIDGDEEIDRREFWSILHFLQLASSNH